MGLVWVAASGRITAHQATSPREGGRQGRGRSRQSLMIGRLSGLQLRFRSCDGIETLGRYLILFHFLVRV